MQEQEFELQHIDSPSPRWKTYFAGYGGLRATLNLNLMIQKFNFKFFKTISLKLFF